MFCLLLVNVKIVSFKFAVSIFFASYFYPSSSSFWHVVSKKYNKDINYYYYTRDIDVSVLYILHTILIENTSYSGKTLF